MVDKRYQVFVSSTFRDLLEERQKVAQALLGMDCIPAGMELFPAIDEEQWNFIKRVIDDCDYYVLILGGRYGSVTADGISYTEKEFDYAVEQGIRVIALLHENPDSLPVEKSDIDPDARRRLSDFRRKVEHGRLVKTWKSSDELPGLVTLSLLQTIKTYPALGWVRQSGQPREELLQEINNLRKEKAALEIEVQSLRDQLESDSDQLASGSEVISVSGSYKSRYDSPVQGWTATLTWDRILYHIAPRIYHHEHDYSINGYLASAILKTDQGKTVSEAHVDNDIFYTIRVQLDALKYVTVDSLPLQKGGHGLFWRLTPKGKRRLYSLRLIQKMPPDTSAVSSD